MQAFRELGTVKEYYSHILGNFYLPVRYRKSAVGITV